MLRVFLVLIMVCVFGDGGLSGRGLFCRDPETGQLHPVNSTWTATSFCGIYHCKIRRKNITSTEYAPMRQINVTDIQLLGENATIVDIQKGEGFVKKEEVLKHTVSTANKTIPYMIDSETLKEIQGMKLNDDIDEKNASDKDRYLSDKEIRSLTEILHTVKKGDLDAIVEIYHLAQDMYKEIDRTSTDLILQEALSTAKTLEQQIVQSNLFKKVTKQNNASYWYEPLSNTKLRVADLTPPDIIRNDMSPEIPAMVISIPAPAANVTSNPGTQILLPPLPAAPEKTNIRKGKDEFFNIPLSRNDFGKLPYYYPMSYFQRMSSYKNDQKKNILDNTRTQVQTLAPVVTTTPAPMPSWIPKGIPAMMRMPEFMAVLPEAWIPDYISARIPESMPAQTQACNPARIPEHIPAQTQEWNPAQILELNPAWIPEPIPAQTQEWNLAQKLEPKPAQIQELNPARVPEPIQAQTQAWNPARILEPIPEHTQARISARMPARVLEYIPARIIESMPTQAQAWNPAVIPEPIPEHAQARRMPAPIPVRIPSLIPLRIRAPIPVQVSTKATTSLSSPTPAPKPALKPVMNKPLKIGMKYLNELSPSIFLPYPFTSIQQDKNWSLMRSLYSGNNFRPLEMHRTNENSFNNIKTIAREDNSIEIPSIKSHNENQDKSHEISSIRRRKGKQDNVVLMNPDLENFQDLQITASKMENLLTTNKKEERRALERRKPAWQTDPIPENIMNEVRANIQENHRVFIRTVPFRKKVKLERVGKLFNADQLTRTKRAAEGINTTTEMMPLEPEIFEVFIEKTTCDSDYSVPGFFRFGNLSEPYPDCCPQRIR